MTMTALNQSENENRDDLKLQNIPLQWLMYPSKMERYIGIIIMLLIRYIVVLQILIKSLQTN